MDTLADRIALVLDTCVQKDGSKWDAKALSKAAGLSPSHVNMMKNGRVKKPQGEVLAAIARAAGVSYRWLATGEGQPFSSDEGAPANTDTAPKMGNASMWRALLEMAKALAPEIPEWVWPIVAESHPLHTVPLTPGIVVDLAKLVMRHVPPPEPAKKPAK